MRLRILSTTHCLCEVIRAPIRSIVSSLAQAVQKGAVDVELHCRKTVTSDQDLTWGEFHSVGLQKLQS